MIRKTLPVLVAGAFIAVASPAFADGVGIDHPDVRCTQNVRRFCAPPPRPRVVYLPNGTCARGGIPCPCPTPRVVRPVAPAPCTTCGVALAPPPVTGGSSPCRPGYRLVPGPGIYGVLCVPN